MDGFRLLYFSLERIHAGAIFWLMKLLGKHASYQVLTYFLATILLGSVLLVLPVSANGRDIGYLDALFTSTSAVCVTGLIVLDTPHDFSMFGQIVILALIQLGGLGIMTFTGALLLSLGTRLTLRRQQGLSSSLASGPGVSTASLLKTILITTFLVEAIGAVILYFGFQRAGQADAWYHAIFHSISAFCNAGFSTFSDSLEGFQSQPFILLPVAVLVVIGGVGFVVIHDLAAKIRQPRFRMTLHSRLCLSATLLLIAAGTAAFYVAEYSTSLGAMESESTKLLNALFQSITTRTAGFNAIPQAGLTEFSILATLLLMFIGGCPGSTAGGIKTTTVAVLGIMGWRRLTGYRLTRVFHSSISTNSTDRGLVILVLSGAFIVIAFAAFVIAEGRPLPHHAARGEFVESLFEVISAFGTVGLSMGKTGGLDAAGKIIVIVLMFTGRVGLLTLVLAMARQTRKDEINYLDENVMVG